MYNIDIKKIYFLLTVFLGACATQTVQVPQTYQYKEIHTPAFTLAAWVKQTSAVAPFHVYIEGDGRAYTNSGFPSSNPTPTSQLMRQMAFADKAPNVVYLARPCQFVQDSRCTQKDWTTARFSPRAVVSVAAAIKKIVKQAPVEIYAYSGGALLSGLIIENYPEIKTQKWITYAGLLNHTSWTKYKKLAPLTESMDLKKLPCVAQTHYVRKKDKVIPLKLSQQWTNNQNLVVLPKATHSGPFVE